MATHTPNNSPDGANSGNGGSGAPAGDAEKLTSLLADLDALRAYLQERGRHSYDLAQRFLANARRDAGSRAYDERQATMLEYQHYIWHEIAGRVSQLLVAYGDPSDADDAGEAGTASDEGDR
jgi:hypothetical protein